MFRDICDTFGEITGWAGGSEAMGFLDPVSWGDVVTSFETIVGVKVGATLCIRMSLTIVSFEGGSCTGTYFRKNFLFQSVTLLDLSTLITYWLNCQTLMSTPVLSHLHAYDPTWF